MTFYKYIGRVALFCLLIQACSTSLTPVPDVADMSLLTGEPCKPPCWQELTPGVSSMQDVLDFVEKSPLIAGNYEPVKQANVYLGWWWMGEAQSNGRINYFDFASGLLSSIEIHPNTDIMLVRILETYGPPEKFTAWKNLYDNSGVPGYNLELLYPEWGLVILWEYNDKVGNDLSPINVCPDPNHPASLVTYYTLDIAKEYSDSRQIGTVDLGKNHYSGDALAKFEKGIWVTNCLTIISK